MRNVIALRVLLLLFPTLLGAQQDPNYDSSAYELCNGIQAEPPSFLFFFDPDCWNDELYDFRECDCGQAFRLWAMECAKEVTAVLVTVQLNTVNVFAVPTRVLDGVRPWISVFARRTFSSTRTTVAWHVARTRYPMDTMNADVPHITVIVVMSLVRNVMKTKIEILSPKDVNVARTLRVTKQDTAFYATYVAYGSAVYIRFRWNLCMQRGISNERGRWLRCQT